MLYVAHTCEWKKSTANQRKNGKSFITKSTMFDLSGMNRAFDQMRENAERQGKNLAKVQADDFVKTLKMEGKAIAPSADKIFTDVKKAGFKIYRKKGTSVKQELQRRYRASGRFGKTWQIDRTIASGNVIRIYVVNQSGDSAKVDNMKGVSDRAEKLSGRRFKSRLENMANSITSKF